MVRINKIVGEHGVFKVVQS